MSEPACTHLGAVVVRKLPFAVEGPLIRSLEPGEDWSWCYLDQAALRLDGVTGPTHIPPSPLLQ